MSLKPQATGPVPEHTARVAQLAFPKGSPAMSARDQLGAVFEDAAFAHLYPPRGQPALAPWRLALVTVLQFAEGLSDRQAALAVRGRIDWKYALALELEDAGFDHSVLCEFRARLVAGQAETLLFEAMLAQLRAKDLLRARGRQRTDSTHVLAAVRQLNRLEYLGETLRAALTAVAGHAPTWLRSVAQEHWRERYGRRVEDYRLPTGQAARQAYAEAIGADGHHLLAAAWHPDAPAGVRALPAVAVLRHIWVQQFHLRADGTVVLREGAELPPAAQRATSPYDPEARFADKGGLTWSGYKAHLTETCDDDRPPLITQVTTTPATTADLSVTAAVHAALSQRELPPAEHLVDTAYVDAALVLASRAAGIDLIGPIRHDVSWQARAGNGYAAAAFTVDWRRRVAVCPQGQASAYWQELTDRRGRTEVHIRFPREACRGCAARGACTRAKTGPRELSLRPDAEHAALQELRRRQATPAWRRLYDQRAGIEGCLSQALRRTGLRRARYLGLAKTHLQHCASAAALNLLRLFAWYADTKRAKTRVSHLAALLAA